MTPAELAAIRQRYETLAQLDKKEGWEIITPYDKKENNYLAIRHRLSNAIFAKIFPYVNDEELCKARTGFIVHARADIPALLDEVERLREALGYLVAQIPKEI